MTVISFDVTYDVLKKFFLSIFNYGGWGKEGGEVKEP